MIDGAAVAGRVHMPAELPAEVRAQNVVAFGAGSSHWVVLL